MRMGAIVLIVAAASAPGLAERPGQGTAQSISYETGVCFGRCPVYRVTVDSNGNGRFEGRRFTAVEGSRTFRLSHAQFLAFASHLSAFRPRGVEEISYGHPRCRRPATDHPSVTVTWGGGRREDRLSFYYGCRDAGNAAMARALQSAPDLLPIRALIGTRP
jgi:hypothetical protein